MRAGWGILAVLAALAGRAAADDAIVGRVLGIDGRPAPGSAVVLVEEGRPLKLTDLTDARVGPEPRAEADSDGRFRLPRPGARFALLAMDRRGVAIRTAEELAGSPDLALRPWGRVSGTVRLGARPDPDRTVTMNCGWVDGRITMADSREARSDARGHFTFDRVLPGLVSLARTGPSFDGIASDLRWVDIEPGATAEVVVGGIGRPVVGRLAYPEGATSPHFNSGRATLARKQSPVPLPPEWSTWDGVRKVAWRIAWDATPEGAAYLRGQNRHVGLVAPDGTFRVEDVPPGRYNLIVYLFQRLPEAPPGSAARIAAQAVREVELPPLPGGTDRAEEPLQLDPTEARIAAPAPALGEPAPDFAVRTLDDKPLRLSDYRGRYVLLDFWATWCVPCAEELPHLKATSEAFGGDRRFALLGLSLDDAPGPARRFADSRGIAWTQGFLGDWSSSPVAASYDVQSIPSIWLIGPDGRVVARNLHGPAIREAVAEALGRR